VSSTVAGTPRTTIRPFASSTSARVDASMGATRKPTADV
jgi:hypothetical protein